MPITRPQAVSANASSATLSAVTAGDYIVVFAYNASSTTIPTLATGFTSIDTQAPGGSANASRLGFKVAAGGETSTGTWTNATRVSCVVLRGNNALGTPAQGAANSAALAFGALTLSKTDGSSWVIGFSGAKAATAGMNGSTALLTNVANQTTVNALSSEGGLTAYAGETLNVTTSGRWLTEVLEVTSPNSIHTSSGALVGGGGVIAGSAALTPRTYPTPTLAGFGVGGAPMGSKTPGGGRLAVSTAVTHATTGALAGAGAAIAGTAARSRAHPSSGALQGDGAVVAGVAAVIRTHASSGVLAGAGAAIAGTAARSGTPSIHTTSGSLAGAGGVLAGTAAHIAVHATSGALAGPGATVVGAAARTRLHATSGALAGDGASLAGAATHVIPYVAHRMFAMFG